MITGLLIAAAPAIALGPIGRQQLPAQGCAAFLWSEPRGELLAMAGAAAGQLRLMVDGKPLDLPLTARSGEGDLGFAARTTYAAGDVSATLDMSIARQQGLTDGATVPAATLTVGRLGGDELVVPAVGLIGCAAT